MTVISVVVGSTRDNRFPDKRARWIASHLRLRAGVETRLLDLWWTRALEAARVAA